MTTSKKKRMSMLDSLAASGAPAPAAAVSQMSSNRALRSARDAVDAHHVWELDPKSIQIDRINDRLDPDDVGDLRDAIEANGQTVPILVRRHPDDSERYLLVYGRRRLEAIRASDKVTKVRALVANLDDHAATKAQISENMARRDLSYIEKALFAKELIESGFGNQNQVAEVLTVTKSSISMALTIADLVGRELIRTIGAAHGVGRPRWEALGRTIEDNNLDRDRLIEVAQDVYGKANMAFVLEGEFHEGDLSVEAFEAVMKATGEMVKKHASPAPTSAPASVTHSYALVLNGQRGGMVKRTAKGLNISLQDGAFADWVEAEAQDLIEELHARWRQRAEE